MAIGLEVSESTVHKILNGVIVEDKFYLASITIYNI